MTLAGLRELRGMSVEQVAAAMRVPVAWVTELEAAAVVPGMMRRYTEAIGGTLRFVVEFDDAGPFEVL